MSLPKHSLSQKGRAAIDNLLRETVESKRVPATFFGVTTADSELYYDQKGDRIFGKPDQGEVDEHTILRLFSCTKLYTAIACYQLIDQGKISLHDSDVISRHLPELKDLPILHGYGEDGKEILSQPKTRITLNMLLTHTSGMGYDWVSPLLGRWCSERQIKPMLTANTPISSFLYPLLSEPGTRYAYSPGYEWAGFLVSRVTGLSLEEYFQKYIFEPCGMSDTSFYPSSDYARRRMEMVARPGSLWTPPVLHPSQIGPNLAGGVGLFGTARDHLRLLRAILASADPDALKPLISAASFRKLFADATPQEHRGAIQADLSEMAKFFNVFGPAWTGSDNGKDLGHSPGLLLNLAGIKEGRSAGSGCWFGLPGTMFWLDPVKGVAAVCFTNLMPAGPDPWNEVYNDFERLVYDHLEAE